MLTEAAAGLIGTIGSSVLNAASQARTNAVNRAQAEDAWRKEVAATREMNVYNSPSMQVARLRAAGLSPTLAYGANGEAVGNQSSIPAFNPIPGEAPKVGDLGAPFITAARLGLETREQLNRDNLAIAELAVKDAHSFMMVTQGNLNTATSQEILSLLGYKIQDYENKFMLDEARYSQIQSEIDKNYSQIGLNEAEIRELDSLVSLNDARASEIYALLPAHIRNLDANTAMAYAQAGLFNAEIEEVSQKVETLQFNRNYESAKFKFEQIKNKQYNARWKAEHEIQIKQHHADLVTGIFRTVLGGAMIRSGMKNVGTGSIQRQPSPIITPTGGSMFGQNWGQ